MTSVLMLCLGNICRSPTAEAVLRAQVAKAGLSQRIRVASAGTAGWHIGKAPDSRSQAHAQVRGYDLSTLRARQLCEQDFYQFDYILAMDDNNLADAQARCPKDAPVKLLPLLSFLPEAPSLNVPDPYYGGDQGFEQVLDLVEQACAGLLATLNSES